MKKIYNIFYILAAMLCFAACTPEQDDYFDESSAERIKSTIAADTKVLTSASNGWLMKYYPDEYLQYGGFNVLLKFSEDGSVTVANELYDADETATSLYQVKQDAGVVLTFDTYNELFHLFSDPEDQFGLSQNGKGFEGDYDFLILEASADKVVLKGKKSGTKAVLTPFTGDWTEYMTTIQEADEVMYNKKYSFDVNGTAVTVNTVNRTLSFSYTTSDGNEVSESMAYIVTPTGYEFYEPVNINGTEISGFDYNTASDDFSATDNKSITMVRVIPPLSEQFVDGEWFFYYSGLSSAVQPYFVKAYQGSANEGETIYYMYLSLSGNGFIFNSGGYSGYLTYKYTIVSDDEVKITFGGQGNSNGVWYYQNAGYNYVISALGNSAGVTYKLSTDDDLRAVENITMTNEANPARYMTVTSNVVYYPFNN
jgi:hypothetical protein